MPLQDFMKIISVDDHLIEHRTVWTDRLPSRFRDAGPQIIETEQGHHVWRFDGGIYPNIGLNAVAGKPPEQFGVEPLRYEDMIPGCYDPVQRLKDMDLDGVHAALCFPSFPGFGGGVFHRSTNRELAAACIKAWNDYQLDEWCATDRDRYIPVIMIPLWDPQLAVEEIERCAPKGARTISFPDNPVPLGLPSFHTDYWDPIFSAAEAADMPLSLHFGSSGFVPGFAPDAPFAVAIALFATNLMWSMVDLLFSPVFYNHPKLKIALSEGGIGWLPYVLERTDYTWERHRWYQPIDTDTRPSDLFRKHIWGCMIDDVHGIESRHTIGIDRITYEIDYPHSDSNWPNSRKRAIEVFAEVPDDEVHQIVELNARELYNFK